MNANNSLARLINQDQVLFDHEAKTQTEIFKLIATQAKKLKITTDEKGLVAGLKAREAEATTCFENGIAVPHSKLATITRPAIVFVKFNQPIEWHALDGKPAQVAIALLVPQNQAGDWHLKVLSTLATHLAKPEFQASLKSATTKKQVVDLLTAVLKPVTEPASKSVPKPAQKVAASAAAKGKINIVAVTACPVGIAHTYIAEEKLESAGKALGYNIKVETQGSQGAKNVLTAEDVAQADVVLIAADIGVNLDRFDGKKLFQSKIGPAIHDGEGLIKKALAEGTIYHAKSGNKTDAAFKVKGKKNKGQSPGIMQHLMSGVSYMVPFVIFGGILIALSIGIGKIIYGSSVDPTAFPNKVVEVIYLSDGTQIHRILHDGFNFFYYMFSAGSVGFTLMVPILAGYIAYSIAGRAALAPAVIGGFIATSPQYFWQIGGLEVQTSTGFIGGIVVGLWAGYMVRWVNTWRVPKIIAPVMPIFFIPIVCTGIIGFTFIFLIGAPIGWVMQQFQSALENIFHSHGQLGIGLGIGLGLLIGAMTGFDMGGPINKVAFLVCTGLLNPTNGQAIQQPMGMMATAIPVAPLGMGIATLLYRKHFEQTERDAGLAALIMSLIGISEGAIPFAVRDPKRVIPANTIGSAVAGAIAGAFALEDAAPHGGPIIGVLGAISIQNEYAVALPVFFLTILGCGFITAGLYIGFMKLTPENTKKIRAWFDTAIISKLKKISHLPKKTAKIKVEQLNLNWRLSSIHPLICNR